MHLPVTESHETNVSFSFQTTSVSSWFAADIPRCLRLLVLLLLLFEQLVDLPLGHGRVLWDDAVLVHARQKQQKAHCGGRKSCLHHRWIWPEQRSSSKMLHHNKWTSFFPSGSFTCWHKTNYCPQQDPLAQRVNLSWKQNKDLIVSVGRLLKSFIFLEFASCEMLDMSRLMQGWLAPTQTYQFTNWHSDGSVSTPSPSVNVQSLCLSPAVCHQRRGYNTTDSWNLTVAMKKWLLTLPLYETTCSVTLQLSHGAFCWITNEAFSEGSLKGTLVCCNRLTDQIC